VDNTKHEIQSIRLTSTEMGILWNIYMIESLVHHMFTYFLKHVVDINIKDILTIFVEETRDSVNLLESFFKQENLLVPRGITSEDITADAPRLYSDTFYMVYSKSMGKFALSTFTPIY
jgi:hypothetical protein